MMTTKQIYDGEDLFRTFCGWGAAASNPKLMKYAEEKYGQSSQMGPLYSMWKWAFRNPEQAYPLWKEYHFERFPDRPQPTFEEFTQHLLEWGTRNKNIGGGPQRIQRFCAKYNLKHEYGFRKGDTVQVVRRGHPLYQSLMIVEETDGTGADSKVDGFIVNANGIRTQHTVRSGDLAPTGRAVVAEREGVFVADMTKIPKLKNLANMAGTPLESIEFAMPGDMWHGVRFSYSGVRENGSEGDEEQKTVSYSYSYDDFDQGLEEELRRLRYPASVTMDVVA